MQYTKHTDLAAYRVVDQCVIRVDNQLASAYDSAGTAKLEVIDQVAGFLREKFNQGHWGNWVVSTSPQI